MPKKKKRADDVTRTAKDMVHGAYKGAIGTAKSNVRDAKQHRPTIDAAVDRSQGILGGLAQENTRLAGQLQESVGAAGQLAGGLIGTQGEQAALGFEGENPLMRSAKAAQVVRDLALGSQAALSGAIGDGRSYLGALSTLTGRQVGEQGLVMEAKRGEWQQALTGEIGQRKRALGELKSQRAGDVIKTAMDLRQQQASMDIAAQELGLDRQKLLASMLEDRADRKRERRAEKRAARTDEALYGDVDGDGIPNNLDKDNDGDGIPDGQQPSNQGKPPGAREIAGGYYTKPSGQNTMKYGVGPRNIGIYLTKGEFRSNSSNYVKLRADVNELAKAVQRKVGPEHLQSYTGIRDPLRYSTALALANRRKLSGEQFDYLRTLFAGQHLPHALALAARGNYRKLKREFAGIGSS